ncbi:DarT1-associated NADAR antitoxin family protein [Vreelandella venusta]|uniref:DarT1-associated NADAR antitoxin family protein n=1 Tax=Vreelandella venusta TaxID=44935 RepID=UPI003F6668DB
MANRPVFLTCPDNGLVKEVAIEFSWNPGFSAVQKKKNVAALHIEAEKKGLYPLLEISSKSEKKVGKRLSAFSLKVETDVGFISVECAFQGSKVFRNGGPYHDIYEMDSKAAKTDQRLKESGELIGFDFFGDKWPLEPKTAFYDWLYMKALEPHEEFLKNLDKYKGFTDIEFNPSKSINCQARSFALLMSLIKKGEFREVMLNKNIFIKNVYDESYFFNKNSVKKDLLG